MNTPKTRLKSARLKIERANHHINNLKETIKAFGTQTPFTIRREYDADAERMRLLFDNCKPLPPEISLIIGEVVYQQRSALDHLVWQLVEHAGETPTTKNAFPIFTTQAGYKARSLTTIKGIVSSAEKRIRDIQPFQRGAAAQQDPLRILQELNNTDKHRLLIVTQATVSVGRAIRVVLDAKDVPKKNVRVSVNLGNPVLIEDGTQVASIVTNNPEKEA